MLTRGRATLLTVITALALLASGTPANAAQTATVASTSGTSHIAQTISPNSQPTVKTTRACKKAKKAVKRAWALRKARFAAGDGPGFVKADAAWKKAKARRAKVCRVAAVTPATPANPGTASGDPDDPRPAGWVRPADGSGEKGSNASFAAVSAGCPVTISGVRKVAVTSTDGYVMWVFVVDVQNYTAKAVTYDIVVEGVDAAGNNLGPKSPVFYLTTTTLDAWGEKGHSASTSAAGHAPDLNAARVTTVRITCQ